MKLKLLFLALFGRLSTGELEQCVAIAMEGSLVMKIILKFYFHHYTCRLSFEDIDMLVKTENKWIWKLLTNSLAHASRNQDVAQKVLKLPLRVFKQLSRPLSNSCVKSLFDQNIIDKLSWYVWNFRLSAGNEVRLVTAVKISKQDSYAEILNSYLQHNKSKYVFYYPASQHTLGGLGLKYLKVLIDRFDVYYEPTDLLLEDILQTGNKYLVRRLLFRTVVSSRKIRDQILSLYPDMKLAVDISELRRRFRSNTMMTAKYGVCNLFALEQDEIKDLTVVKNYNNKTLIACIMRKKRFHSLSFLAWFVYRYPEFQQVVSMRFYERFL